MIIFRRLVCSVLYVWYISWQAWDVCVRCRLCSFAFIANGTEAGSTPLFICARATATRKRAASPAIVSLPTWDPSKKSAWMRYGIWPTDFPGLRENNGTPSICPVFLAPRTSGTSLPWRRRGNLISRQIYNDEKYIYIKWISLWTKKPWLFSFL